jgi:hypothetical protein
VRGGLDDALAKMARWEELRRRTEGSSSSPSPGTAVEEVVQAARRAVERDRELSVTVEVAYRGRTSAVRVEDQNGEVTVTVDRISAEPPPPPAASPPPPEPPPASPPPPAAPPASPPPPASSPPASAAQPSAAAQLAELLRQESR